VTGPRVLVVDGNRAETRARQVAAGGHASGEGYVETLVGLLPELHCDIVRPADEEVRLPPGVALDDYDGVAMTGSALNVYDGGPHVERQIELAKAVFAAGVPFFGSCWGLQVAVTAAGGVVRPNPRGREFGFGRRILLNAAGRAHPMFAGKADVFEAVTVHRDEIATLPPDATRLASNEMGLQAAEIRHGRGVFWGVQYHPEYSYAEIAATSLRYGQTLIAEGLFADAADLDRFVADTRALEAQPDSLALNWRLGLGPGIQDPKQKLAEIDNWLRRQVLVRVHGRTTHSR
jgi:GMP synthase (glutamine-hydrolysing)